MRTTSNPWIVVGAVPGVASACRLAKVSASIENCRTVTILDAGMFSVVEIARAMSWGTGVVVGETVGDALGDDVGSGEGESEGVALGLTEGDGEIDDKGEGSSGHIEGDGNGTGVGDDVISAMGLAGV